MPVAYSPWDIEMFNKQGVKYKLASDKEWAKHDGKVGLMLVVSKVTYEKLLTISPEFRAAVADALKRRPAAAKNAPVSRNHKAAPATLKTVAYKTPIASVSKPDVHEQSQAGDVADSVKSASKNIPVAYTTGDVSRYTHQVVKFRLATEKEWLDHDSRILSMRDKAGKTHEELMGSSAQYRSAVATSLRARESFGKTGRDIATKGADLVSTVHANMSRIDKSIQDTAAAVEEGMKQMNRISQRWHSNFSMDFAWDDPHWANSFEYRVYQCNKGDNIRESSMVAHFRKARNMVYQAFGDLYRYGSTSRYNSLLDKVRVREAYKMTGLTGLDGSNPFVFQDFSDFCPLDKKIWLEISRQLVFMREFIRPAYVRRVLHPDQKNIGGFLR